MILTYNCLLTIALVVLVKQTLADRKSIGCTYRHKNPSVTYNVKASNLFKNVKTFSELANEAGLQVNSYEVTTADGYILTVFHIQGNGTSPVLLMHGLIDSADTYILRANTSLTKDLVDAGYDVYLGNVRGNKYSRKHISKNPDVDSSFWDYSFHEMGIYDLPTIIDFILERHSVPSIHIIGHSQGNQIMWVMGSEKPEYNRKVKVAIALAPICFVQNISRSLVQLLIKLAPLINWILKTFRVHELISGKGLIRRIEQIICPIPVLGYVICVDGIINPSTGFDNDQLEPYFFTHKLLPQFPSSVSVKNALHLVQLNRKRRFSQYDYGVSKNIVKYNSIYAPAYDLSRVTMKVFLLQGLNDKLATVEDTRMLRYRLPNILRYAVVNRTKCSHTDFVWGKDANIYINKPILQLLKDTP